MLPIALGFLLLAASPEQEIRKALDRQVEDWNRGDIAAFMNGYEESEEITFLGRSGLVRGWKATLERYKRTYSNRDAMGTLRFSELNVRLLSGEIAIVTGRFDLDRNAAGGGPANGRFTVVMKKMPRGWRIVHDHTS
jgi:ketosteroid isomerase-like protein